MLARPWLRLHSLLALLLALALLGAGIVVPARLGLGLADWSKLVQLPSGRLVAMAPAPACGSAVPDQDLSIHFADGLRLIGYDLESPRPAGDFAILTLYWQAESPPAADYKVFVHLLDDDQTIVAQDDGYPAGGAVPTSDWEPGAIVGDAHFVDLPADLPPGSYDFAIGLYQESTGRRLDVREATPTASPDAPLLPEPLEVSPAEPDESSETSH